MVVQKLIKGKVLVLNPSCRDVYGIGKCINDLRFPFQV